MSVTANPFAENGMFIIIVFPVFSGTGSTTAFQGISRWIKYEKQIKGNKC